MLPGLFLPPAETNYRAAQALTRVRGPDQHGPQGSRLAPSRSEEQTCRSSAASCRPVIGPLLVAASYSQCDPWPHSGAADRRPMDWGAFPLLAAGAPSNQVRLPLQPLRPLAVSHACYRLVDRPPHLRSMDPSSWVLQKSPGTHGRDGYSRVVWGRHPLGVDWHTLSYSWSASSSRVVHHCGAVVVAIDLRLWPIAVEDPRGVVATNGDHRPESYTAAADHWCQYLLVVVSVFQTVTARRAARAGPRVGGESGGSTRRVHTAADDYGRARRPRRDYREP